MRKHLLAVLAYVVATFAVQAVSHFGVNAAHYAAVTYLRAQPIFALGVLSMLIQGTIMSYLYAQLPQSGRSLGHAVLFAWLVGSILVSYEALAEAAKYVVPSVASWICGRGGGWLCPVHVVRRAAGFGASRARPARAPLTRKSASRQDLAQRVRRLLAAGWSMCLESGRWKTRRPPDDLSGSRVLTVPLRVAPPGLEPGLS